jgi:hypothetical protein
MLFVFERFGNFKQVFHILLYKITLMCSGLYMNLHYLCIKILLRARRELNKFYDFGLVSSVGDPDPVGSGLFAGSVS